MTTTKAEAASGRWLYWRARRWQTSRCDAHGSHTAEDRGFCCGTLPTCDL